MPDVFVSYSRRDEAFVQRLVQSIEERGKSAWIDVEGIGDGEVFPQAIRTAIEQSDAFVFVITPDSVQSTFCENEVDYAVELQKRLVPLLRKPVLDPELPEAIRERNWIPFDDDGAFPGCVDRLVAALDTDLEYAKEHTRWLVKAIEWENEGKDRSFMLRGSELKSAESFLGRSTESAAPAPTALQREYVYTSSIAASRRQRLLVGASLVVAAVSIALLAFALVSRSRAISERVTAKSRALAAESQTQVQVDPELAILLGVEAVRTRSTPEALFALRQALDESPSRLALPAAGAQRCGVQGGPGIAYAPDGRRIAEGLCNGDVVFLDARTGRAARRVHVARRAPVVAFDRTGSQLAVGTDAGVRLLDVSSGAVRATLAGGGFVNAVAFSPDGSRVAATTNAGVTMWTVSSRRAHTLVRATHEFDALAFSHDGRLLVVGSALGVGVFDGHSGELLRTLAIGETDAVALPPRGPLLALLTYEGSAGVLSIWDTRHWRKTATLARFDNVQGTSVAFSPDGTRVAAGAADGTAGLWAMRTHRQLVSFLGHVTVISQIVFSPDSRRVATSSQDGTARIWHAGGNEEQYVETDGAVPDDLVLSRRSIVAAVYRGRSVVRSFSAADGRAQASLVIADTPGQTAFLSPDGRLAAVDLLGPAHRIVVWSLPRRRVIRRLPPLGAQAMAFAPDSRRLAVAVAAGPSLLVDLATGRRRVLEGTPPSCASGWRPVAFSRDGRLVAAGTFCGQVVVWNAATGRRIETFSIGGQISSMAFNRTASLLAVGSWDSTVTLWDVPGRRTSRVLTGHSRGVTSLAFSPDGSYLATASLDRTARVWDTGSWRVLRILRHPVYAGPPAFSPDGRRLVTDDGSGTIRVWDACTGCGDAKVLLAIAKQRVTRPLTALERSTFLAGL